MIKEPAKNKIKIKCKKDVGLADVSREAPRGLDHKMAVPSRYSVLPGP